MGFYAALQVGRFGVDCRECGEPMKRAPEARTRMASGETQVTVRWTCDGCERHQFEDRVEQ
jgi:RNase P subunit RPR2